MKIIIIHGNDQVASLEKLQQIKVKFDQANIFELSGKNLSTQSLDLELSSQSLFSAEEKLLIYTNPGDETAIQEFQSKNLPVTLVLYFNKELPPSSEVLSSPRVVVFRCSKERDNAIFTFLDLLTEKNPQALKQLDSLLSSFGTQYLLTMLYYNLRKFILPTQSTSSFVLKKISQQKKIMTPERIRQLFYQTLDTDFKIKQGKVDERTALLLLAENYLA